MTHIDEHTKVTLTLGQLRRLVTEEDDDSVLNFPDRSEAWGHYEDNPYMPGGKEFVEDEEAIGDAIMIMFYWIEQNTNLEIRYAKCSGESCRKYQLWGKPDPFFEKQRDEFDQEVELIREQLRLLELQDYIWVANSSYLERKGEFGPKEWTCSILFPKRYPFDFNKFKKETRPKDNYHYQNRSKIKKIDHPPKPKTDTPF